MSIPQATPPADRSELLWSQDEYICRLFATSATFQAKVGAADAGEALDHIIDWADVGDDYDSARILVRMDGGVTRSKESQGCWVASGSIPVMIECKQDEFTETNANYRTSKAEFRKFFSKVLKEVETQLDSRAAILGFNPIDIKTYSLTSGPWLQPASEVEQYDESDSATPENRKNKVVWWVEFTFELF